MLGHMLIYEAGVQFPEKMSPGPTQASGPLLAPGEVASAAIPGHMADPSAADWNKV